MKHIYLIFFYDRELFYFARISYIFIYFLTVTNRIVDILFLLYYKYNQIFHNLILYNNLNLSQYSKNRNNPNVWHKSSTNNLRIFRSRWHPHLRWRQHRLRLIPRCKPYLKKLKSSTPIHNLINYRIDKIFKNKFF
jgi:hypothetical protein